MTKIGFEELAKLAGKAEANYPETRAAVKRAKRNALAEIERMQREEGQQMSLRVRRNELAGFFVAGWRQEDGRIALGHSEEDPERILDEWPEEMSIEGFHVYTLEEIETNDGRLFMPDAVPDKPGFEIAFYG